MSQHILKLLRFFPEDRVELQRSSTADVSAALADLLAQQEKETHVNGDLLLSAGRKFRVTGHDSLDAVVESWLSHSQTCKRFDIASLFLAGHWGGNSPIRESLAAQLMSHLAACETDNDALTSMLVALCQLPATAASEAVKSQVQQQLAGYARRAAELGLQPGTVQLIDKVLNRSPQP